MSVAIKVPSVGESITEGTLARWLKKDGDAVRADEPVVELETDKATQEVDEVKTMLINQGYPEATVHRFFSPLSSKNVDVVDKTEELRQFYAYINRNGTLHNNGMVATGAFIAQLERELTGCPLFRGREGDRAYVFLVLEDAGNKLSVGFRKLGMAHLKGLEKLAVYEILDGAEMAAPATLTEIRTGEGLAAAVEREFAKTERWQHA